MNHYARIALLLAAFWAVSGDDAMSQPTADSLPDTTSHVPGRSGISVGVQLTPLMGISLRADLAARVNLQLAVLPKFIDGADKGTYGARFLYSFVDRRSSRLSVTGGVSLYRRNRLLPVMFSVGPQYKMSLDQLYFGTLHYESHFGEGFAWSVELGAGNKVLGVKRDYGFPAPPYSGVIVLVGFGFHYFFD